MTMTAIIFGLFGLIVGSFLNVVVLRRGTKTLSGRSGCFSCGSQLRAADLVPVLSWLILKGRCRACGSGLSKQYPLVESITAVTFALVGGIPMLFFGYKVFFCAICAVLILITAYDMRHTIIPDEWAYGFALLALGGSFLIPQSTSLLFQLLAGPLAALPLFLLWLVSRGRWMGLGDAKLALGIGWLLGPINGVFAIFFAFIIGAVVSVAILIPLPFIWRVLKKTGIVRRTHFASYTMKSEVPFGPFLILSCLYVWFSMQYALPIIGMP